MPAEIRLLLVDAPLLARRCLASVCEQHRGFRLVADAGSGDEVASQLPALRRLRPTVAVVDPGVPGGAQLLAALRRELPGCAVIALAQPGTDGLEVGRALKAGVRGYVTKDCEPEDILRAIERVHAGQLVVHHAAADAVGRHLGGAAAPGAARGHGGDLTPRERDVLALVTQGKTNPEIARQLSVTEHTVKGHVANLLRKLGRDNRVQLAAYGTRHHLQAAPSSADGAPSPSDGGGRRASAGR